MDTDTHAVHTHELTPCLQGDRGPELMIICFLRTLHSSETLLIMSGVLPSYPTERAALATQEFSVSAAAWSPSRSGGARAGGVLVPCW